MNENNSLWLILKQNSIILFLIVVMIFFQWQTGGIFLRPVNITNVILQQAHILILAIGMLMVIVLGHIDLSVGSVAAFTGGMAALMMSSFNMNPFLVIVLSLIIGGIIGAWQGFWVAYMKIPAFIVTLAGMMIFRGLTIVALGGQTISVHSDGFRAISSGFIANPLGAFYSLFTDDTLNIMGLIVGLIITIFAIISILLNRKKRQNHGFSVASKSSVIVQSVILAFAIMVFSYTLARHAGIPNVLMLLGVLVSIYHFVTSRTKPGRYIYAIGGNEKAAELSGIKTKSVVFWTFVNMGFLAALSGIVFTARLGSAMASAGDLFELNAIAACFIGGASASGGVGTIKGAILGGLIMAIIANGMSLMGVGTDWQQAITGGILLAAVAIDVLNKKK